jgi:hypothetical protein
MLEETDDRVTLRWDLMRDLGVRNVKHIAARAGTRTSKG